MGRGFIHVGGLSVLLTFLGAAQVWFLMGAEAFTIIFSPDLTTDFAKGGIDVPGILKKDWAMLPLQGSCGLASKYGQQHKYNLPSVRGTLHTTFEYLTGDCTAEFRRDTNLCSTLTAAFLVCAPFPLDPRMTQRTWGYCSNFNFRVSYLWVPNEAGTTALLGPVQTTTSDASSDVVVSAIDPTDPDALAAINKDMATLDRVAKQGSTIHGASSAGGRTDTGCNWKYSNIIPVAWDGIQNTLVAGQYLASGDTQFAFAMQEDCNLVLYRKGFDGKYAWNAKWATFSNYSDPFPRNCSLELQPTGNLVVRDPDGNQRWASNKTTPSSLYSCALAVLMNGNVVVYELISGTVIWATNTSTAQLS